MIRLQRCHVCPAALGIGLLLALAGCSNCPPDETLPLGAIAEEVGTSLPADAVVLTYHHRHSDEDLSECSRLWILRASSAVAGPDRRTPQKRARSPFGSLKSLVEQATDGEVLIDAADATVCECVEWRHGETMCRLRQTHTRDGWVMALEAVSPH